MGIEQKIQTIEDLQITYCRTEVIAKMFGVTVRRVQQLTQEGIISTQTVTVGGRRMTTYALVDTVERYTKHLADRAKGRAANATEEELKKKKLEADIALKESQGELHRLRTAIANGEYVSVEEVQVDYTKFFVTFKKFVTNLPSRIIGFVAPYMDPAESRKLEKDISLDLNNVLNAFIVAGTEAKPAEQKKAKRGRPRKAPES